MKKKYYKELIEKYLSGTISESEVAELLIWLEHDNNLNKWWADELGKGNDQMDIDLQNKLLDDIKVRIQKSEKSRTMFLQKHKKTPKIYFNVLKWTAMICLPIILSLTVYVILSPERYEAPLMVKAASGNRTELTLPDGTNVKLNSASQLSYLGNYGIKERRVNLTGEAFFNVTHDIKRPFIVQTGELQVMVLGTSFNVTSYENQENISIVLLKGKVDVYVNKQRYSMSPDDKIIYDKQTLKVTTSKVYSKDYIEWTRGSLHFDNESLLNIAKVLERTYNVEIKFDTERLKKERFSGTLGSGGIQSVLEKLTMAFPFTYEYKDSVVILKSTE